MKRYLLPLTMVILVCSGYFLFNYLNKEEDISLYFPLIENSRYNYIGYFNGNDETSHIQVKKVILNGGCSAYYFIDNKDDENFRIIGSNIVGLGLYYFESDQLYTIESYWEDEVSKIQCPQKQLMISNDIINKNKVVEYASKQSDPIYKLTFEGKEDVKVPAGEFHDCLKFKIMTKWTDQNNYLEYFWLAKNIGMVRWQRSTGRVEELLNYSIPEDIEN